MKTEQDLSGAVTVLRGLAGTGAQSDNMLRKIMEARDQVVARYRPVFAPDALSRLTESEFREFLQFRNNQHWMSLQRMGPAICSDMARLRQALAVLLDESRSIGDRLSQLVPQRGAAFVPRLSKAVLTPILLIAHPDKYGVWNQVSEGALKALHVWPEFDRTTTFGRRYESINGLLQRLATGVGVDLWTLDALFWRVEVAQGRPPGEDDVESTVVGATFEESGARPRFGLERYLHEFLRDNWDRTDLGKHWKLHEEDGDPEAGYEYPCDIGRIDLLAHHRTEERWLVVELKRAQSSDQTVGQVMRYMGWVRKHLAQKSESVEGLVIAHEADASIDYALAVASDIRLQLYDVQFTLHDRK